MIEQVDVAEFCRRYCETQDSTTERLLEILKAQHAKYNPDGWMMLRCEVMDSSAFGSRVVLPYGPGNTWKEPPSHPVSPRGLASDTSTVECVLKNPWK